MYTGQNVYTLKMAEYTAGYIHGMVIKTQDQLADDHLVGLYIPKIMGLIDASDGFSEQAEPIDTSIFANKAEYKPTLPTEVVSINYLKIRPMGFNNFLQPVIALGESAHVIFIDGDFKEPRYLYSHNNEVKRATDEITLFVYGKMDTDDIPKDYYKAHLNSRTKKINIHMSAENGEVTTYDVLIDGQVGEITAFDGHGNIVGINTNKKLIWARNVSDTELQLSDTFIHAKCTDDMTVDCNNYIVTAKTSIKHTAGAKIIDTAPKVSITGDATIELKTTNWNANVSAMFKNTCPMSIMTGSFAASVVAVSPTPGAPPAAAKADVGGSTLTLQPRGPVAFGDMTVKVIKLMLPFLKKSGLAKSIVKPILPTIPSFNVEM